MRVMIAGGGTGGHVYPGIAIFEALRRRGDDVDVLFVGAKSGVEGRIFAEAGLPHVLLAGRGVRGASLLGKVTSPFVFFASMLRASRQIRRFDPDVVIGTGGFASVSVVVASVVMARRRVLQEQNSVPGMANRVLSRFANLVLLSYEESKAYIHAGVRTEVVGNPLRVSMNASREAALEYFGLRPDVPTVLVFGGSRGARAINQAAQVAARRILASSEVQFVMLTGAGEYESVAADMKEFAGRVKVYPFLDPIHHAYAAADVAVARAGASSVFELAAFRVPSIFVPYPYAADDHQKKNVASLEAAGAARVIDNSALEGEELGAIIQSLLGDEVARRGMSQRMGEWAKPNAADEAARYVADVVARQDAPASLGGSIWST